MVVEAMDRWERAMDRWDAANPGPEVVCLCGSSRFLAEMSIIKWELEKGGRIALSMSILPSSYPGVVPDHQAEEEGVKEAMDELHLRKIDLADRVLVVDVGGYIGESTRREIEYAESIRGIPIDYFSKGPKEAAT